MAARADILGDTGAAHPDNWVGGLAGADLHAIAILFARDDAEHARATGVHDELVARCDGVRSLSVLDLNATPPFNYAHDHFGFRDRLSQPVIEGSGEVPTPGSGAPLKPGEFILGYPDEHGSPEICRSQKSWPAMEATWPTGGCRNMLVCSATICRSTPTRRTIRNCSPRSSWAAGAAAPRWCWHPSATIPSWARTPCATTTSTTRRWIRTGMPARSDRTRDASTRATPRTT